MQILAACCSTHKTSLASQLGWFLQFWNASTAGLCEKCLLASIFWFIFIRCWQILGDIMYGYNL